MNIDNLINQGILSPNKYKVKDLVQINLNNGKTIRGRVYQVLPPEIELIPIEGTNTYSTYIKSPYKYNIIILEKSFYDDKDCTEWGYKETPTLVYIDDNELLPADFTSNQFYPKIVRFKDIYGNIRTLNEPEMIKKFYDENYYSI